MRLTVLTSAAELLLATDHNPFVRATLRSSQVHAWLGEGATAWLGDRHAGHAYLSALGTPSAVGALLEQLLPELPPRTRLTVPRGTPAHLPAWVAMDGAHWDFRWLESPPPHQPGEPEVLPVDDEPSAVTALLQRCSPTASHRPGDADVQGWVGVTRGSALVACAANTSKSADVGHLSSIAVDHAARGRGLGSAVSAAMSRQLLAAGAQLVTLGVYADNVAGRALYDRLGFHDEHRFTSGPLQVRSRW